MRTVNTTCGMTRDKGLNELFLSSSLKYMQKIVVPYKRTTLARVARDHTDVITVLSFRHDRNPFTVDKTLLNIETGGTVVSSVNVQNERTFENNILESITGRDDFTIFCKRSM